METICVSLFHYETLLFGRLLTSIEGHMHLYSEETSTRCEM